MAKYDNIHILKSRSRATECREDTTALLLAKLTSIATDNDVPYNTIMSDLGSNPGRLVPVCHALVGLVVQYAEGAGGFLKLCNFLISKLDEAEAMFQAGIRNG